jgi:hypothetical protein
MHSAEAGNHAKVKNAALARFEGIVTPHSAPTIGGKQFLELAVEVVSTGDGPVNIVIA